MASSFPPLPNLPVAEILPALLHALRAEHDVLVVSPPGSGKTTLLPIALLRDLAERIPAGQKILLLEPRRMAARAAAWRMAELLGEPIGETVGYHVRLERRESSRTRILVLTEGLLARRIQLDPLLSDAAMVLFDEFHERSLHADLGLALCRDIQREVRPELRLLILSATLDAQKLLASLEPHWCDLHSEGRLYPVDTHFLPPPPGERIAISVARAVRHALAEGAGGVLAFLPGEGEIRSAATWLAESQPPLPASIEVCPLYAALTKDAQDAALRPPHEGTRKVVLATSIAESSLTIEGMDAVVDCGWMRVPRFSPSSGMESLETIRITRDRADQRRGRAGRLRPGRCYRLWDRAQDDHLLPAATPEILSADLVPLRLAIADIGYTATDALPWVTPPPAPMVAQAESLLQQLEALDASGRCTSHGHAMAELSLHPRLAHAFMLAIAARAPLHSIALLAAFLAEGGASLEDASGRRIANIHDLLDALEFPGGPLRIPSQRRSRILTLARDWEQSLQHRKNPAAAGATHTPEAASVWRASPLAAFIATAFPDRIARRRTRTESSLRFLLSGGRGATLRPEDPLAQEEWLAIADLDGAGADAAIRLAIPFDETSARALLPQLLSTQRLFGWDSKRHAVLAVERTLLGAITLREQPLQPLDPDALARCLCEGIRTEGLETLALPDSIRQLQARMALLRAADPEGTWPDLSDPLLLRTLEDWLLPWLPGCRKLDDIRALDLHQAILAHFLTHEQRQSLPRLAPTHIEVPSGSKLTLDYTQGAQPILAVRIQEVFGLAASPRIASGRIPVLMHLLSPARRPVQVTSDLASFWANGYPEVRKDLRGRYPKHDWPEDPTRAIPHRGVRKP